MISIIDYGMGNILSIQNMLKKAGGKDIIITNKASDIEKADKIILPGVGAYDMGMKMLKESGLIDVLNTHVTNGKPIFGICLGMQLLGKGSEEGNCYGLGYIDFYCKKIVPTDKKLLVPHMGWEYITIKKKSVLTKELPEEPRYYFVHSYHAVCNSSDDVLMTCNYGEELTAAVEHKNVYGTQFHPEKSHHYGMQLLKNFVENS